MDNKHETIREEKYWLNRNPAIFDRQWETINHPHRKLIINALKKLKPFNNLLEVGSGCGANLKNIKDKFPESELTGIDLNKHAIFSGERHLSGVNFIHAPSWHLPFFDKTFDVVLTDATLMYLAINRVKNTIIEITRVAKRGIIMVELDGESRVGELINGYWHRDYKSLLESEKWKVKKHKINIWKDLPWEKSGFIYIATPINKSIAVPQLETLKKN